MCLDVFKYTQNKHIKIKKEEKKKLKTLTCRLFAFQFTTEQKPLKFQPDGKNAALLKIVDEKT